MRGKALAALVATAAALFSCDRHVPGSVPMQAKSSDPTDHSAVPATPPDEEPEKLSGVVYVPDMPEDMPEPVTPPDEEPIKLGGDVPYMPEPSESSEN